MVCWRSSSVRRSARLAPWAVVSAADLPWYVRSRACGGYSFERVDARKTVRERSALNPAGDDRGGGRSHHGKVRSRDWLARIECQGRPGGVALPHYDHLSPDKLTGRLELGSCYVREWSCWRS